MDNGDRLTTTATAERMAGAASAFLGALTEEQRKQACYGFGDERRSWSYLPARDRDGLPIGTLDAGQKRVVWQALAKTNDFERAHDLIQHRRTAPEGAR